MSAEIDLFKLPPCRKPRVTRSTVARALVELPSLHDQPDHAAVACMVVRNAELTDALMDYLVVMAPELARGIKLCCDAADEAGL